MSQVCVICTKPMGPGEPGGQLNNGDYYHNRCLDQDLWLKAHQKPQDERFVQIGAWVPIGQAGAVLDAIAKARGWT